MAKSDWRGTNVDKRSCCASGSLLHSADVKDLQMARRLAQLKFPFSIPETVEFYRVHYGAILKAFAGLSETDQAALRRDLEDLYVQHNDARDGTTCVAAEYLEVVGTRT
jgi:hypothetical protein